MTKNRGFHSRIYSCSLATNYCHWTSNELWQENTRVQLTSLATGNAGKDLTARNSQRACHRPVFQVGGDGKRGESNAGKGGHRKLEKNAVQGKAHKCKIRRHYQTVLPVHSHRNLVDCTDLTIFLQRPVNKLGNFLFCNCKLCSRTEYSPQFRTRITFFLTRIHGKQNKSEKDAAPADKLCDMGNIASTRVRCTMQ